MFPCGTVRLADSLWYLQKGSWVMWSQQRWCLISLMYQKTWDCGERKVLFTKRHPSSDMCYSFHPPHPPPFILSHRLNPRWERTLSFVYVYNEMPRLPPLLLPRSGSDHGIIPHNLKHARFFRSSRSYHTRSNLRSLFVFSRLYLFCNGISPSIDSDPLHWWCWCCFLAAPNNTQGE